MLLSHPASPPALILPPPSSTQAGQAWAELEELEAAEAALSRAAEAAAALAPLCFERRGRGPAHQDTATLCFQIQLERLGVALRLGQEVSLCWWARRGAAAPPMPAQLPQRDALHCHQL